MNYQEYFSDEENRAQFLREHPDALELFVLQCQQLVDPLPLARFSELYVSAYDAEATLKGWKGIEFQSTLGNIWTEHRKSRVLAPREHLKTTSVLAFLLKRIFTRTYPLEISYYHINEKMATEKLRKLRRIIDSNEILGEVLKMDDAKSLREDQIILSDETIIQPLSWEMGVVGKHPHIIVLDDVIDRKVIYSDEANQKAINKFYSDIYPMISKDDPDRQIIIIGTAQRADDLYHSLPADFYCSTYSAILNEEKKKVLAPDLFTFKQLTKIRSDISQSQGEKFWLKEYQNIPMSAQGLIFKAEDVRYYVTPPKNLVKFQGWDLAVGKDLEKGDWTVCVTIGVDNSDKDRIRVYILDIYRARISFGDRLKMIGKKFNEFKPLLVGIEEVAFQYDTIQALKESTLMPILGIKALTNKVQSFQTELAPYFENGQIYVREDMKDFVNELLAIPASEYDDQADALKIAIKTALQEPVKPRVRII